MTEIAIVMPEFNEGERLGETLKQIFTSNWRNQTQIAVSQLHIIVVDDGSIVSPKESLASLSIPVGTTVHLLKHQVNLGQGASLQTGIEFARKLQDAEFFVTMDSDGQHSPDDIPILLNKLIDSKLDVVFGNRFGEKKAEGIPFTRVLILSAARIFEKFITGLELRDAHNGFRAFNKNCASVINLKQNRMAHATEFKQIVARNKLKYGEVSVQIRYTQGTLEKGQRNSASLFIIKDLLNNYFFDRG